MKTVRLAVRPEDLLIIHEQNKAQGCTCIPATIDKITFTGSLVQYTAACEGGYVLTVERHKPEREALIPKGSPVFIEVPVESVLLFDPDTGRRV